MRHFDLFPQGRAILCLNYCQVNHPRMELHIMEARLSSVAWSIAQNRRQISLMTSRDNIEMPTSLNSPTIFVH